MKKEKLMVLKACDKEPGTVPQIAKYLKIKELDVEEILRGLKKEGLVYKDEKIWVVTLEGGKKINEKI